MKHGVLLLDKPAGISSNAALQRVRRLFEWSKAGHTGTLDPLATGLLPICLGEATKFSHSLLDADKTYEATIRLGFRSTTGDAEGEIEVGAAADFPDEAVHATIGAFIGPLEQIPPMHSALKKDGRPLYSYARAGESFVREARKIIINRLQLIDRERETIRISVDCSKGTYVRVLAQDIGEKLGCGGYLLALRRTGIRDLSVDGAIGLEGLAALPESERDARLLPVDCLVNSLPAIHLDQHTSRRIVTGQNVAGAFVPGLNRLYDQAGSFLGLGEAAADGNLVPKRLVSTVAASERPRGENPN
ncbi:MAG TPA: tRNA pseudouridine(55) synthase TruB [Burkholderiales bacterium]|nr:tRNA pseudouridine(55) synthase TruB [Burkholderiales bacterium]